MQLTMQVSILNQLNTSKHEVNVMLKFMGRMRIRTLSRY